MIDSKDFPDQLPRFNSNCAAEKHSPNWRRGAAGCRALKPHGFHSLLIRFTIQEVMTNRLEEGSIDGQQKTIKLRTS